MIILHYKNPEEREIVDERIHDHVNTVGYITVNEFLKMAGKPSTSYANDLWGYTKESLKTVKQDYGDDYQLIVGHAELIRDIPD